MRIYVGCSSLVMVLALLQPIAAKQAPVKVHDWTIPVPDRVDCSRPPVLVASGPGTIFDETNKPRLQDVLDGVAPAIRAQCPEVSEVILQSGRTKRLVQLRSRAASAAASVPPVASVPSAAPAPTPTPAPQAAVTLASPPPETPARPAPPAPVTAPPSRPVRAIASFQDRRLGSLAKLDALDKKCELLLDWLGRLTTEYPQGNSRQGSQAARGLALYRDEDFAQVFGQPFDQTTTKSRAEIHGETITRCQGNSYMGRSWRNPSIARTRQAGMTAYASQFEAFRELLDGPFLSQGGRFSPQAVEASIAAARQERAWMLAIVGGAAKLPGTADGFAEIESTIAKSRTLLANLWPSELTYVTTVLTEERSRIASIVTSEWTARIPTSDSTLENLRQLADERRKYDAILKIAPPALQTAETSAFLAKVDLVMAPVVATHLAKLTAIPATLEGARAIAAWRAGFDSDVGTYRDRPAVVSGEAEIGRNRQRIFDGAYPEWQRLVDRPDLTQRDVPDLDKTINELFPASTRTEARYQDFRRTVVAAVDRMNAAAAAAAERAAAEKARIARLEAEAAEAERLKAAAAAEAERRAAIAAARAAAPGAVRRCDDAAGHPDDAQSLAAAGVSDAALVPTLAIKECLAAVAQSPQSARSHFQLGRAYWAAKQYDDALESLFEAEALSYAPAYYYLGLAYEEGRVEGEEADLAAASEMYLVAAADGFKPAIDAYQSIDWSWDLDFKSFSIVWAMRVSYENHLVDLLKLQRNGVDPDNMVWYASGIQDFLELSKSEYDGACPGIARADVSAALYRQRRVTIGLPAAKSSDMDDTMRLLNMAMRGGSIGSQGKENLRQGGTDDADLLVADYGGCDGEPLKKVYSHISDFILAYDKRKP